MDIRIELHATRGYKWSLLDSGIICMDGHADSLEHARVAAEVAEARWASGVWFDTKKGAVRNYGNSIVGSVVRGKFACDGFELRCGGRLMCSGCGQPDLRVTCDYMYEHRNDL